MAAGDLIVADGQAEIRGLLIGAGTAYPFTGDGPAWWSKPNVRAGDLPLPAASGALATLDLSDVAVITLTLAILGDSPADFVAKRTALATAWATQSADAELVFQWGGEKQRRVGRTRNMAVGSAWVGADNTAEALLQFVATDPLVYGATLYAESTGIGEADGAMAFPLTFPLTFGTATPGGVTANNAGSAPAPWVATLYGPLTSPRITHIPTGRAIELAGFVLNAGQTLVIDSATRTVLLNGTTTRYGSLTRREWFGLDPGDNFVQLNASAGTGTMTLEWRDASL